MGAKILPFRRKEKPKLLMDEAHFVELVDEQGMRWGICLPTCDELERARWIKEFRNRPGFTLLGLRDGE